MRYFVFGILFLFFSYTSSAEQSLKSGDFLFVSSRASDFEQAIVDVTKRKVKPGFVGPARQFSHVAMVNVTDSGEYSELIYFSFAQASGKSDFFETPPMTFKANKDADYLPYWVDYFAKLNIPIPEGKPGLNPNGMVSSEKIEHITVLQNY